VVIAIIAILRLAVARPGQGQGESTQSPMLSNLHQVGLALLMYANENNDYIPRSDDGFIMSGGRFSPRTGVEAPTRSADQGLSVSELPG